MEESDLIRRMRDLADRSERSGMVTHSSFLTPAEQYELQRFSLSPAPFLFGGQAECERKCAFFLPDYLTEEYFDASEYLRAVSIKSYFGEPGHRDYMGAILGLGIARDRIGDIYIMGDTAFIYCLPPVEPLLLNDLEKVGRYSVKCASLKLEDCPAIERKTREVSFTVKSLRLDAVTGGMFSLSRTAAAEAVRQGLVTLNYSLCDRVDAEVREGDVISLRGHGKGVVAEEGGRSRKDRIFLHTKLYI